MNVRVYFVLEKSLVVLTRLLIFQCNANIIFFFSIYFFFFQILKPTSLRYRTEKLQPILSIMTNVHKFLQIKEHYRNLLSDKNSDF